MADHELEQLFGGFAADTLTADERQRLYQVALRDQQLFNALADEQALKELLADPDVRRRLLQALQQTGQSAIGGKLPWWAWLRKPAGLAWAGGLAAAAFAIAFGTRIYQESFDRAAQSVMTEEAKPAAPSLQRVQPPMQTPSSPSTPEVKTKEPAEPAQKATRADKLAKRERSAPTTTQEPRTSQSLSSVPRDERDEAIQQAPLAAKNVDQLADSTDRTGTAASPPPPSPPKPAAAPTSPQAPAGFSAASAPPAKKSARALFYGQESERSASQAKPLGLRYSFVTNGIDGRSQEVTAAMAARSRDPVRITVEATQEAYVQLLQNLGSAGTRLWWPPQETGKISLKLQAGKRTEIPMPPPAENGLITLIIRLSSKPFGPLTMQEVGMLDRFSANLVIETVSAGMTTGVQEQATYVVSQDPSTNAQLAVEIPVVR